MSKGFSLSFPCRHFLCWVLVEDLAYPSGPGLEKRGTRETFGILQDRCDKLESRGFSKAQLLFLTKHLLSSGALQESGELGQKLSEGKVKSLEVLWKWPNSNILLVLPSKNLPWFQAMKVRRLESWAKVSEGYSSLPNLRR